MCTHYRLKSKDTDIAALFEAAQKAAWEGERSIYPDQPAPVIGHGREGLVLAEAIWGISPPANVSRPVVNIRNLSSPFWRVSLKRRNLRCLVPADSFAEWSDERDPQTHKKVQHFFELASAEPMAFAGMIRMQPAREPSGSDGSVKRAHFAFLTCEPNAVVGPIHQKAMPVILPRTRWKGWLNGDDAAGFQYPLADNELRIRD